MDTPEPSASLFIVLAVEVLIPGIAAIALVMGLLRDRNERQPPLTDDAAPAPTDWAAQLGIGLFVVFVFVMFFVVTGFLWMMTLSSWSR